MKRLFLALLFVLLMATAASAKDVIRTGAQGYINWTSGYVYAKGFGPVDPKEPKAMGEYKARRVAIVEGQRNLLEMTKGVRLDSTTVVEDMVVKSSVIKAAVSGLIVGAEVVEGALQPGGMYTVTMRIPIRGKFLKALMDQTMLLGENSDQYRRTMQALASMIMGWMSPAEAQAATFDPKEADTLRKVLEMLKDNPGKTKAEIEATLKKFDAAGNVTGLVIDATGVPDFDIAACPLLKTADGKVLYPSNTVTLETARTLRPVTYDLDMKDAKGNKRVASEPMIVKAVSTYKKRKSDLVLSPADANRVKAMATGTGLLSKCKVVIVVSE